MSTWIKRLFCLLLALFLLTSAALAEGLPEQMDAFMAQYGLHEGNFSLCYRNTVTGETYRFNEDAMMMAASTYKLPLNMYYYELEAAGELAKDAYIPLAGTTLDRCHEMSLLHSDNDTAMGLLYNLGNFRTYKDCMRKYFTVTDQKLSPMYYMDNYYCTAMMMDALEYLYSHEAEFSELLGYLKDARPGEYFKRYITDIPVAHKYGSFEGAENDVGIIYAKDTFLLAVYTQGVGEVLCGKAAELLRQYTDAQHDSRVQQEEQARLKAEEEAREKAEEEARLKAEEEAKAAEQARLAEEAAQKEKNRKLTAAGGITGLCAAALAVLLATKRKNKVKS